LKAFLKIKLNAENIELFKISPNFYKIDIDGKKYFIMYSDKIAEKYDGYDGPCPVVLLCDENYKIKKFFLLPNRETPGFIKYIERKGFFTQFLDKTPEEILNSKIDTVTRATLTTSAVKNTVKDLCSVVSGIKLKEEILKKRFIRRLSIFSIVLIFIFYSYFSGKFKKTASFISVIFLGFLLRVPITFQRTVSFLKTSDWKYFFTSDVKVMFFILFCIAMYFSIFKNKTFYCMHICPYGNLQNIVSSFFKVKSRRINPKLYLIKYFYLFILMFVALFIGENLDEAEPFIIFNLDIFDLSFYGALFLVIISIFYRRFWCKVFCPTGALFSLFGK
jgi:hypothetical protein